MSLFPANYSLPTSWRHPIQKPPKRPRDCFPIRPTLLSQQPTPNQSLNLPVVHFQRHDAVAFLAPLTGYAHPESGGFNGVGHEFQSLAVMFRATIIPRALGPNTDQYRLNAVLSKFSIFDSHLLGNRCNLGKVWLLGTERYQSEHVSFPPPFKYRCAD
jgi:hypothetical protein